MSLPPVVSDVEGPCPARTTTYQASPIEMAWRTMPHDWVDDVFFGAPDRAGNLWKSRIAAVCRYCLGRKP